MLKLISTLFSTLLFVCSVIAQNNNSARNKIIKWPKYYKATIPKEAPAVATIRVMLFLWDTDHLGYAQVGIANKKISAIPEKPFLPFIQDYIAKQYSDDFKQGGTHLLWIVKDLRINERTLFSSEHAFVRLKADAYLSADGSAYRFVDAFDTVLRHGGMDVTALHGQNMAKAFHLLLIQSLEQASTAGDNIPATLYTVQQIEEREKLKFAVPVLSDTTYREGLYATFDQFLQNNPSVSNFEAVSKDKKVTLYAINGTDKNELSTPWGICKEGEIYKYADGDLIPIEKDGNGFVISTYLENINRRNKNIFIGSMLGGVAGAVIGAASPSSQKIYNVTAIPYITKKQPEACAIDMATGELTF